MRAEAIGPPMLLLAICGAVAAETFNGRVVRSIDGDTLVVVDQSCNPNALRRVRLAGIDAPERRQGFGQAAKMSLASMVLGRVVEVRYKKRDRYGRVVGKVLAAGHDVGLEQVRVGLAWHYKAYQGEQSETDRTAYAVAESAAIGAAMGLWAAESPVPPWKFRNKQGQAVNTGY